MARRCVAWTVLLDIPILQWPSATTRKSSLKSRPLLKTTKRPSILRKKQRLLTHTRWSLQPQIRKFTKANTDPVLKPNSRYLKLRMHQSKQPAITSKFSLTGKMGMARTFSTRNTLSSRCTRCPSAETRATRRHTCLTKSQTCAVRPSEFKAADSDSRKS